MNARMACFVWPLFQEGSGSAAFLSARAAPFINRIKLRKKTNGRSLSEMEGMMRIGEVSNVFSAHPCWTQVHAQTTHLDVYQ
ncbi:protein of unknown function [Methylocaldum szegediense]|uniref:Secreted protein n=1 Tax=Methylocaldum szegediense TaxID=73780 RepID=A0ABN8WZ51_9GAMM|nr:protein of unknown function [Methylocaldum szegediense]